jgi:MoaA/NifB/PqqE/SkfB family radical SAM enzyme
MRNVHGWPLEHWHIEICSKCSLKCPRCSRQEVPEGLTNGELSLGWFKSNFTGKILSDVRKITFCGDDGDPIYAKDLLDILQWLRGENSIVQFVIVTNGSYKTKEWWEKLDSILNEKDHIHFSLDGWDQESNDTYRVNCDWDSISSGIDVLSNSRAYKTWAAIAFKFNEDKLEDMKKIAREKKFDNFQLTLSSKFGKNYGTYPKEDPLQPSDRYVAQGRFTREYTRLSDKEWQDQTLDIFTNRFKLENIGNKSIIPLCMIGNKGLYLNSKGMFRPCCWTGLRYQHNKDIFHYIDFGKELGEVMDDPNWTTLFSEWNSGSGPMECSEKCSVKKWNLSHATNW